MKYYRTMAMSRIIDFIHGFDCDKANTAQNLMSQIESLDSIDADDSAYMSIYEEANQL